MLNNPITVNTILYCRRWPAMVRFYRDLLRLPVNFATDWFVEFCPTQNARFSIADAKRSTIESADGKGITLAFEVEDIASVHRQVQDLGLKPTGIRNHPWDALVFHLIDPEGNRLEIWQSMDDDTMP